MDRLRRLLRRLKLSFIRLTGLSLLAGENYVLLVAIFVGVLAGLGSVAFIRTLDLVHELFFVQVRGALGPLGPAAVIFLPALGGLIVGPLIARFAPEAGGHGVPEVMAAVATRGGRIHGRVALVKTVASAVTIGSGGSSGQEGPMVQIGAASASAVGRGLGVAPHHMRTIVACGGAGGLAAVFNVPVGGAIFALEVITGELTPAFGAVILSSVSATAVSRSVFGNYPSFVVPRYDLVSNAEFVYYAVLGVVAGLVATLFIRTLYGMEARFERWAFPSYLKPAIGGLMVGIIGRFAPEVFGTGSATIEAATWGRVLPFTLLMLVPLKILATSLTLGSGGSGGVFGPSMFIGATLGGAFGWMVNGLFPEQTAGPGAYALVGLGAMIGGTSLAPLTAIIMLFEMTDDYRVILPVMVATVLAIVVTRSLVGESIYTLKLRQQKIAYYAGAEIQRVHGLSVQQAMRRDLPAVAPETAVSAALTAAMATRASALPVVDGDGRLHGVVTVEQLSAAAAADPGPPDVAAIATPIAACRVHARERLDAVLARLGESDVDALVVTRPGQDRVLGVVSRRDVMRLYEKVLRQDAAGLQ